MNSSTRRHLFALIFCLGLALVVRLPHLTAFITADEARSWFGRSIIFLDALSRGEWANTAPNSEVPYLENVSLSPAPGVTTMWLGAIGICLNYICYGLDQPLRQYLQVIPFDPLDSTILFWLRLPGVLVSVVAVGLTFWWTRPLLGLSGATLTAAFLALDPFHVALSRVLGHDAMVATFMGLSLLASLHVITLHTEVRNRSLTPYHFASAFFAALAVLSKYPALFIAAFIIISLITVRLWQLRHVTPKIPAFIQLGLEIALWLITFTLTVVLFWPALWQHPIAIPLEILQDAARAAGNPHQKGSFFLGQPVPDPGFSFYLLVLLFRTTPVIMLGVMFTLAITLRQIYRRQWIKAAPFGYILLFIILYTLLISYGGKKQDRYLLPIFPALAFIAASGYTQIIKPLPYRFMIWSVIISLQFGLIISTFPYYFTYYNPLLGGAPQAARLMQVGWGEGLNEAAMYLNQKPNIRNQSAVSWYSTTFEPYFRGQTIYKIDEAKISRDPKPGLAANYAILYINQLQRQLPSEGALAYFQQNPPIHVVTLNGLDYAQVYTAPAVSHIISQTSRLVGQAELLGFDWLDGQGQRLTILTANSVPTLRLYWEWQGKSPDEPIHLSLVDRNGYTIGWAHEITSTETTAAKVDGTIITSDYALAIFPGTPPGDYALKAWIDRPATNERVGDFPLDPPNNLVTLSSPITPAQRSDFELTYHTPVSWPTMTMLGYNLDNAPWPVEETRSLEIVWTKAASRPSVANITIELIPMVTLPHNPTFPLSSQSFTYSPNQWHVGDIYREFWPLTLPRYLPPGQYQIALRLNDQTQTIGAIEVLGRERFFAQPRMAQTLNAPLGDSIQLLGYTLITQESSLQLTLFWQALATPPADYTVFVQLLDATNQVIAQQDQPPQAGNAPTGTWVTGEIITDSYTLSFQPEANKSYRLFVGMYQPDTGQRLPTSANSDTIVIPLNLESAK